MSPKVSVIIPVYNVAEYLGQCLDTILLQTLQDIEVICVDDGSTDDSLSILNTYAMFDDRLKVIHQDNKGAAAARNQGLKQATGEFMIFLDADDFFEGNMLEEMVAKAEEDGSDIVCAGHYLFDNNIKQKTEEVKIEEKFVKKSPAKPEDFGKDLFTFCDPAAWNKLIRSHIIKENNLSFDESASYVDDVFFACCSLTCSKQISIMKDSYLYYRTHLATQQTSFRKDRFPDTLRTMVHLYDKLKQLHGDKFLAPFIPRLRRIIAYILNACPSQEKREKLLSIRPELPSEIVQRLFSQNLSGAAVSIIIPVYNAAEFLPECLDSCLNQTLKEIEIICVDDGSTDNSLEILNDYAKRDNRIIVLQQKNQRQAIARNKAMEVATGEFIQFLDADDYMEPDTCECLYLYSTIFGLDMCQCTAVEFYNHNKKEFEDPYHCLTWLPDDFQAVFNHYTIPNILPHMAVTAWLTFYRRNFLIRHNIKWINKKIAYEDTPFFVESILKAKRVGALKTPFYHRRVHSAATTQQMTSNFNEYVEILKYTLKLVKKLADQDLLKLYCHVFLQKVWINFARFEQNDKLNMAKYLYDFCQILQKKYRIVLPPDVYAWCLRYLKNLPKSYKERLKFAISTLKAKCVRDEYHLNLFQWQRSPFKISILNLPILYSTTKMMPSTEKNQKEDIIHSIIWIKFCGIPFLKIKEMARV